MIGSAHIHTHHSDWRVTQTPVSSGWNRVYSRDIHTRIAAGYSIVPEACQFARWPVERWRIHQRNFFEYAARGKRTHVSFSPSEGKKSMMITPIYRSRIARANHFNSSSEEFLCTSSQITVNLKEHSRKIRFGCQQRLKQHTRLSSHIFQR